jgi:hypothetical protein
MAQAFAAIFGAAFTVAACWGAGVLAIGWCGAKLRNAETVPLAFVLGASCAHLAVFAVMAAKIAYQPVWWVLLGSLLAAGVWKRPKFAPTAGTEKNGWLWILFGGTFAAFSVLYLANAWAPETSADGSGYHLTIVAKYLRAHGFERIGTVMYASLGGGVEMLYEPAFAIGRHSAASLVHFAFLIALAWTMFAYGLRIGKPWVGATGALLMYVSPVVGRDGTTAYIDVATGAIVFAVFYWLEIWDEQRTARLLVPIGLLAGYCYAAKYTAFVMVPYAVVFVAWRARRLPPVIVVAGCAAVMIAPWMIKDWIFVDNPVAPFANELFPNPYVHVLAEQQWAGQMRRYEMANLWALPMEVTVHGGKTQSIIGPVFLLAPLGLLALRYRAGRRLIAPGLLLLAAYFGNIGTRFLIPCLPFFSLALALALGNWRVVLTALMVFQAVASWPFTLPRFANPYLWRIDRFPYQGALRIVPQEEYLRKYLYQYNVVKLVEEHVPPGERLFSLSGFPQSYTTRDVVSGSEGALNNTLTDILFVGWTLDFQPTRLFDFHFPEKRMNRVRLLQTARAKGLEQWNVHELRFFSRGVEVERRAEWRLRAWPNPFEIQLAFDNSDATRWRSWQTGEPGMYIDVDFGRAESVDEVQMETSRDYSWPIRIEIQEMDAGRWVTLAGRFEERQIQPKESIRRAATYELLARGFHYLLVQDGDWGAVDYADDPEAWGLEVIARTPGATLFRVVP